jgi:hypothetical protein
MCHRALIAVLIAVFAVLAFAGAGHAFGLFSTQIVGTQAAVAYTDSAESPTFSLDTTFPTGVQNWQEND